ncbi:MAG: efflux RND transporter periplasmic adaptor subunit [Gammaproteobacteria bacterium]|nr:efflux RND transporter periplasmic adaptor subunit [Gammaproteobacteria bacterium]
MKIIVIVLCMAVSLSACNRSAAKPEELRAVKTVTAVSADAGMVMAFAAEIQPRYESELAFRVGGKLLAREINLGSRVKQGQVIARLDPADLKLSATAAQAQVASVEADYVFAKSELERYQQLLNQKFVSAAAFEVKKNAYEAALAKRNAAVAQAAVSENQANYTTLLADYDGVITAVNADPGQVVAAGQPIVKLARTESLDAVVNVAESQIQAVRAAKYARISLWSQPEKIYNGRIREIAGAADIASRTYVVKIKIDDPDNALKLGMTASVVLQGADQTASSATLLPLSALLQQQQQPAVYVLSPDNHLSLRPVVVAQYREQVAVIASGLHAGERVAAVGVHKLHEGERVNPIPEGSLFATEVIPSPPLTR